MRAFFCTAGALAAVLLAGIVSGHAGASIEDETPTIKKIMDTLHKGAKSPLNTVKAQLKSDSPDWSEVQKQAKIFATNGESLAKNDPPKGEKSSFEKLAKAYASSAKSLETSAEKEDLKGARDALKKISTSCMACHKSHRG